MRRAFTLIEMTIVIAIIAILAGMALSVYNTAAQQSKGMRTRAIIAKIDQLIGEKYEGYRTRQVPIKVPAGMRTTGESFAETAGDSNLTNGFRDASEPFVDERWRDEDGLDNNGDGVINQLDYDFNGQFDLGSADFRLLAMRELQRLEMPNQIADVWQGPMVMPFGPPGIVGNPILARPAISKQYLRRAQQQTGPTLAGWTGQFEGAECLHLILSCMRDGDKSALDYFSPTEIGDFDGDGMNEIHDAFGQPIEFVRWPAGYRNDLTPFPVTPQSAEDADQFDPFNADGRLRSNIFQTLALKPLVYSAGPDKQYRIGAAAAATFLADPYHFDQAGMFAGSPNGTGWEDNITNHDLETR